MHLIFTGKSDYRISRVATPVLKGWQCLMSNSAKITVIGSMNMDLIVRAPHIPAPGETVSGGEFRTAAGGKGANQAMAAARLGAQVTIVGCVGDDAHGQTLRAGLQADGINTDFVRTDTAISSGVAFITVADSGENSIVVSPGANHALSPADIEAASTAIAGADVLLLQLEIPLAVVGAAVRLAKKYHVPVVLNPAPAQPLPDEILANVNYFIPNETETALYCGFPITDDVSAEKAAAQLSERYGIQTVALTLGSRGALLYTTRRHIRIPPFTVLPVDTTAAGDAFVGGFAVAICEGNAPDVAARFASAVAAVSVTKAGAQPSLPRRAGVQRFLVERENNTKRQSEN